MNLNEIWPKHEGKRNMRLDSSSHSLNSKKEDPENKIEETSDQRRKRLVISIRQAREIGRPLNEEESKFIDEEMEEDRRDVEQTNRRR